MKNVTLKVIKKYFDKVENKFMNIGDTLLSNEIRSELLVSNGLAIVLKVDKPDYSKLSIKELKVIAKSKQIDIKGLKSKKSIIEKLV